MKLRDVMSRDLEVVRPQDTLVEVAEQMRALNVGAMPVCDGDRLVGIVTDRDIVVRAIAMGTDPRSAPVEAVMTPEVEWLFEDRDVEDAKTVMREKQIRRVLVLDQHEKLVGILSLGDLAVKQAGSERAMGRVIEDVSLPFPPIH